MDLLKKYYQLDIFLLKKRFDYAYSKKIKKFLKNKNIPNITKENVNKIKQRFKAYGFKDINTDWHKFYNSFHSTFHTDYIPESLYYNHIQSSMNRSEVLPALEDKSLIDYFFSQSSLPKTIIKNINGYYYINKKQVLLDTAIEACCEYKEFVLKPSIGTSGGKGVIKYVIKNLENPKKEIKKILLSYKNDFIVQEIVRQNHDLKKLNPTSINTIRIMSYMRESDVVILSATIRIGQKGSFTDNNTIGGMACGINSDGRLKEFAINLSGERFYTSDAGVILKDFKVPNYSEVLDFAKEGHKNLPYFKIVSWDICINDNSEIILIEYNIDGQDINIHQMLNGPLFGEYTDEILSITQKHDPLNRYLKFGK